MKRAIVGFHKDDKNDWVAELECGHQQHVRHNPPWQIREWVTTEAGRKTKIGHFLQCKGCDQKAL
ncbi:MAG: DUF3565 domain-containing protein [Balneola sp.]|jgi:hypothetical protein